MRASANRTSHPDVETVANLSSFLRKREYCARALAPPLAVYYRISYAYSRVSCTRASVLHVVRFIIILVRVKRELSSFPWRDIMCFPYASVLQQAHAHSSRPEVESAANAGRDRMNTFNTRTSAIAVPAVHIIIKIKGYAHRYTVHGRRVCACSWCHRESPGEQWWRTRIAVQCVNSNFLCVYNSKRCLGLRFHEKNYDFRANQLW